MAPEVLKKQSYGVKADVFSFGICLCELLTGRYPYEDNVPESTNTFEAAIMAGLRPAIPSYCPLSIRSLITSCWSDDPEARPSVDEIMDTLVATERQLLAAENLTILDELPEELSKLFEDQQAESAFLAMSIKQLKGQLDAAQARASEWEEKWEKERATREELEKAVRHLRDQLNTERHQHHQQQQQQHQPHPQLPQHQQHSSAHALHLSHLAHSSTQPMPILVPVPVLMRGSSNVPAPPPDAMPGSRRTSMTGPSPLPVAGRRSGGSGVPSPVPPPPPLSIQQGSPGRLVSPAGSQRRITAHSRSPYHSTSSPRSSPSTTPSPTHCNGPPQHPLQPPPSSAASHCGGGAGLVAAAVPPAAALSPAHSAPHEPPFSYGVRTSTGSSSPTSRSPQPS